MCSWRCASAGNVLLANVLALVNLALRLFRPVTNCSISFQFCDCFASSCCLFGISDEFFETSAICCIRGSLLSARGKPSNKLENKINRKKNYRESAKRDSRVVWQAVFEHPLRHVPPKSPQWTAVANGIGEMVDA